MSLSKSVNSLLLCTGAGIRIAVLDSGLHPGLPSFKDKNLKIFDCKSYPEGLKVDRLSEKNITDRNGHGSFVQSCIFATAPDAEIDHYRVLDENNSCEATLLCQVIDHVLQKNYHIIHLSLGTKNEEYMPWLVTLMKRAYEKDVTIVAACSNIGNTLYPSRFTYTLSCDAVVAENVSQLWFRPQSVIEFAAWGVNVPVMGLDETPRYLTGSSYAAAHLTGLAARAIELQSNPSPLDTKILLREYALSLQDFRDDTQRCL